MLLPDGIYRRVPVFWMLAGILFLMLGMSGGSELAYFPAYIFLGVLCIARSIWIYQARWKFHRRNKVAILKSTQIIKHEDLRR